MSIDSIGSFSGGWARRAMTKDASSDWLTPQANVTAEGGIVEYCPNSQLCVIVLQSAVNAELGYTRFNGVNFDYQYSVAGRKNYAVGGTVTYGYFGIGAVPGIYLAHDGDIRQVLYGEGQLSPATLLKLEGYLAHDGDIESLLPLDHPYRNDPPE